VSAAFNAADVQGNIVRGYRKPRVRHLVLEVTERNAARCWLAAMLSGRPDGIPQITTEEPWETKPVTCFNIGLTYEGLRALGTPGSSLETFPTEFIEGMNSRALKLGDAGPSAPETWPAPFDDPKRLHLIATIYADDAEALNRVQQQALPSGTGLTLLGARDGWNFEGNYVHFGYRDSIAQPKFAEIHDTADFPDGQPMAPLGTVLLDTRLISKVSSFGFRARQPSASMAASTRFGCWPRTWPASRRISTRPPTNCCGIPMPKTCSLPARKRPSAPA
jgi:hypothetical protein